MCEASCNAIADTGTTLIIGPENDVSRLNAKLGTTNDADGNALFDCSKLASLPSKKQNIFYF